MKSEGKNCLKCTCMMNNCPLVLPHSVWMAVLGKKELKRYVMFHVKSYVEENAHAKWCPKPGCETAIKIRNLARKEVNCECGFVFCLKCYEWSHQPVTCDQSKNWLAKECDESETLKWIQLNTKSCPGCKNGIEKNQGCNHMTCQNCRHEFCWMCMENWSTHGDRTGGYFSCNIYEKVKDNKDEMDKIREKEHL